MFSLSKMLDEIHSELRMDWQLGAFKWADENMSDVHKKVVDRFDAAIGACTERSDWVSLKMEAEIYKNAMLDTLRAYKKYKQMDEQTSFLEALRAQEEFATLDRERPIKLQSV